MPFRHPFTGPLYWPPLLALSLLLAMPESLLTKPTRFASSRDLGWIAALVVAISIIWGSPCVADLFLLNPTGQFEGELLNPQRQPHDEYQIRTDEGVTIALSAKRVKKVRQDSLELKRYQEWLPKMPETASGNWKMAQWCAKKGLVEQRKFHLEQVIALDPEHEPARRALGYVRVDDQWTLPAERMKQRGYVRYRGDWMLPQEIEMLERRKQYDEAETVWIKQIKKWRRWIGRRQGEEALENLLAIKDPLAAGALAKLIPREDNIDVRSMYVRVLGQLGNETAVMALAKAAMEDGNHEIRLQCLDGLERYGGAAAVPAFMERLRSSKHVMVQRAAVALGRLGDDRAVSSLIDALVTTHKVKVAGGNPGSVGVGFGTSSSGDAGVNSFSAGGKPRIVINQSKNREVLDALVSLTDPANYSFQYDEVAWRQWYSKQSTPTEINLRRFE